MLKIEVDLSHEGKQYYECSNEKIELPKEYVFFFCFFRFNEKYFNNE